MLIASALIPLTAQSQTFFADDFESYDDFSPSPVNPLSFTWFTHTGNGVALSTNRNLVPELGTQSVVISNSGDRAHAGLPFPGLDAFTHAKYTIYIFATNQPTGLIGPSRVVTGPGAAEFSSSTVGIGWHNNASGLGDSFDGTAFQGKDIFAGGDQYFNLNNPGTPRRSGGWHKFDIERLPSEDAGLTATYRYYVDDILGRTVVSSNVDVWGTAVIGFGAGTQDGETWYDGLSVATNFPLVVTQPQSQDVVAGATVNLSVVANNATSYQWRFNVTNDIAGATSSSLSITNFQAANVGAYSVVVGNANGSIGSAAAIVGIGTPKIVSGPDTQTVSAGSLVVLQVTATGADPLFFQWRFHGTANAFTNNVGAQSTDNSLTLTNFQNAEAGFYSVVASNAFGTAVSTNAQVLIGGTPMRFLWTLRPGDRPYLTAGSTQRGMGHNPVTDRLIVTSRSPSATPPGVFVLDAATGADLHTLDTSTVSGGFFLLNVLDVADDGAIYAANLTLSGPDFKIYRWANDDAGAVPTEAFPADNPAGERLGDTIAVRGAGVNTEILCAVNTGTNVVLFTTTDGLNFTAQVINITNAPGGFSRLGIAWGGGDVFWSKSSSHPLRRVAFDRVSGKGGVTHTLLDVGTSAYTNVTSIGVDVANDFVAGTQVNANPHQLRLFDTLDLTQDPTLLDTANFLTVGPTAFGTAAVDFGGGRVYALNTGNGIIALDVVARLKSNRSGNNLVFNWSGPSVLQSASSVEGPYTTISGATSPHTNAISGSDVQRYFRLLR